MSTWYYLEAKKWVEFSDDDQAALEDNYVKGDSVKLGSTEVVFADMIQKIGNKSRQVRRVVDEEPQNKRRRLDTSKNFSIIGAAAGGGSSSSFDEKLLNGIPVICRDSLEKVAKLMRPSTRWWLGQLGRAQKEVGLDIRLPNPLDSLDPAAQVRLTSKFSSSMQKLTEQADAAIMSSIGRFPKDGVLIPHTEKDYSGTKFSAQAQLDSQLLLISGPVFLLYDGRYQPVSKPVETVLCSIPGINFAYSTADQEAFTVLDDDRRRMIHKEKALSRMETIFHHVLSVMDSHHKVIFPVLCAIGCGAFKGKYGSLVPRLWAEALGKCLQNMKFTSVEAVFVSVPTFNDDNNFKPFDVILKGMNQKSAFKVPVILVEDASMVDVAAHLSMKTKKKTGILNPSDVQALRHGWVGMYWDEGHVALEEILGMQTTALLHHAGVNPTLYTDSSRHKSIKK